MGPDFTHSAFELIRSPLINWLGTIHLKSKDGHLGTRSNFGGPTFLHKEFIAY